ncbi:MAG: hypothetical protein QM811_25770 [Pirellulales bacterium]
MRYLPYDAFTLDTDLAPGVVVERLRAVVEPYRVFRFGGYSKPFQGYVEPDEFAFSRVIEYRNSFLPRITGRIVARANGTTLDVRVAMHPFVTVFLIVWLSGVTIAFLVTCVVAVQRHETAWTMLIPLGMLLFGYGLAMGGFWSEARGTPRTIQAILNDAPRKASAG